MQKISDNVYVETELAGSDHGFVVTKEGVVMIDTPQLRDVLRWREEIARYGPVRYIIITEPHVDHFPSGYFFEGTMIGHEGTREAILATSLEESKQRLKEREPNVYALLPDDFYFRAPTVTLSERMTIHLGDHTFRLINHPGHTPYQVTVHIPEERVAFVTDNIFHKVMTWLHESVPYQWLESLKRIQELDVDVLIPGHGLVCDKSYIPEQAALIQAWVDGVLDGINKGMTVEEMQDNLPYRDPYAPERGLEQAAERIPRMSVEGLYKVLKK